MLCDFVLVLAVWKLIWLGLEIGSNLYIAHGRH